MKLFSRARLGLAAAVGALMAPALAHADPISSAILLGIGLTATPSAIAATTFLLEAVGSIAVSLVSNALFGPKAATTSQDRQADVLALSVGEVPRQVAYGRVATGGTLADASYFA